MGASWSPGLTCPPLASMAGRTGQESEGVWSPLGRMCLLRTTILHRKLAQGLCWLVPPQEVLLSTVFLVSLPILGVPHQLSCVAP